MEAETTLRTLDPARRARALAQGFGALVVLTYFLIVLGALVRANDAGLACPDWPRCYGVWLPPMDLRVAFEWTHRLVAGSLAVLFVSLGAMAWRDPQVRERIRGPWLLGLVLLTVQIVLGGLTVLLRLAPWTVTAHLLTANTFASLLLVAHDRLAEQVHPPAMAAVTRAGRFWMAAGLGLLALQVALGGLVASHYAGLVCTDWPACRDGVWFPTWSGTTGIQLAHRTHAWTVVTVMGIAAWSLRRHPHLGRLLALACALAIMQVVVGVANVLLELPAEVTGLHSALSAALVLTWVHTTRECWRSPIVGRADAGPTERL